MGEVFERDVGAERRIGDDLGSVSSCPEIVDVGEEIPQQYGRAAIRSSVRRESHRNIGCSRRSCAAGHRAFVASQSERTAASRDLYGTAWEDLRGLV